MYKCNNCNSTFDSPNVVNTSYESYYGVDFLFINRTPLEIEVCPNCGEDSFEEVEEINEEEELENGN